mmetsp:Transcript_18708/g.41826  ORF Transcript_18708/g.41826 Transcript_18708/m.41826 type:complete len:268 (+) Transcript_18708:1266-2069(+)
MHQRADVEALQRLCDHRPHVLEDLCLLRRGAVHLVELKAAARPSRIRLVFDQHGRLVERLDGHLRLPLALGRGTDAAEDPQPSCHLLQLLSNLLAQVELLAVLLGELRRLGLRLTQRALGLGELGAQGGDGLLGLHAVGGEASLEALLDRALLGYLGVELGFLLPRLLQHILQLLLRLLCRVERILLRLELFLESSLGIVQHRLRLLQIVLCALLGLLHLDALLLFHRVHVEQGLLVLLALLRQLELQLVLHRLQLAQPLLQPLHLP